MENFQIVYLLREIAVLLELAGDNPFKSRAFNRAADTVEQLDTELYRLAEEGELLSLNGIGRSVASVITEYMASGTSDILMELRHRVPPGLVTMLNVEGLGVKRVRKLHNNLNITTQSELREACMEGKLATLSGFGPKLEQSIIKSLAFLEEQHGYFLFADLIQPAREIVEAISRTPHCIKIEIAGDFRRRLDTAKELVFVVATHNPTALFKHIGETLEFDRINEISDARYSAEKPLGFNITIETATPEEFASLLMQLTGSIEHLAALKKAVAKKGFDLRPDGIYRDDAQLYAESETDIYKLFNMQHIEPEIRNGDGEVELAERSEIPKIIALEDIKGMIHVHSAYSDGANSIFELAKAAMDGGYEYLGICDHSKAAVYANGLDEDRLARQIEEIDTINSELKGFRILKGIEVDIMPDGKLDLSDEALQELDFVIASVHTLLKMTEKEMTERVIRAIENPYTSILGHPTGRLILSRPASPIDMNAVIEAAARTHTAIELNANPHRLDISYPWLKRALEKGVKTSINTDAHSAERFIDIHYGVMSARRSMTTPQDVLNTLPVNEFIAEVSKKRT